MVVHLWASFSVFGGLWSLLGLPVSISMAFVCLCAFRVGSSLPASAVLLCLASLIPFHGSLLPTSLWAVFYLFASVLHCLSETVLVLICFLSLSVTSSLVVTKGGASLSGSGYSVILVELGAFLISCGDGSLCLAHLTLSGSFQFSVYGLRVSIHCDFVPTRLLICAVFYCLCFPLCGCTVPSHQDLILHYISIYSCTFYCTQSAAVMLSSGLFVLAACR